MRSRLKQPRVPLDPNYIKERPVRPIVPITASFIDVTPRGDARKYAGRTSYYEGRKVPMTLAAVRGYWPAEAGAE